MIMLPFAEFRRGGVAVLVMAVMAVMSAGALRSQVRGVPKTPVHWSARVTRVPATAADTARVELRATIDEFFHLYSTTQKPGGPMRTTIELVGPQPWAMAARLRVPAPDTIPDGNFGIMSEVYDDSVTIGVALVARPSSPAIGDARFGIRYQACTARYCLPPRVDTIVLALSTKGAVATAIAPVVTRVAPPPPVVEPSVAVPPTTVEFGGGGGPGAFLLLAASMGALALLTPCVFPMIPITVTSFLAVADTRWGGVRRAVQYALGIVASFTGLGVATAAIFGASGLARFAASPWVNLAIAALFTVFALSLFGAIRLALPSAVMMRLSGTKLGSGALGPPVLGALFTLTAFTCTAPFVGTLLVMSAQGNWRWPLIGMVVFSAVFAAPFFALALIPGLIRRAPRAGEWMPALEVTVGAIELAAAAKFISNADLVLGWGLFTRRAVIGTWVAILLALIVVLLWKSSSRRSGFRLGTAALAIALSGVLAGGLFGKRLGELDAFLPPMPVAPMAANGASGELPWMLNDYKAALAIAARDNRPVLVDFTGYTCTNCRWMEANMFPRNDVKRALDRFIRVRLYTDGIGEPYASQQRFEQATFGTVALPLYAVLDATGRPRATFLGMTRDATEFTAFLDRGATTR